MLERLKYKSHNFQIDSRKVNKGDVFLCLKGEKTDGHLFINDALKNGASYVVVEKDVAGFPTEKIIKVNSVLEEMLISASTLINENSKLKIGITGSTGKTTTKECLYYLLLTYFKTFRNEMNLNTEIGIPLSILNNYNNEETVILEEGLRKKGDLEFLSKYFKLDVAIITNVGASHLEFLDSLETVAKEKMKITSSMDKGVLIINGDYSILKELAPKHLNLLTFGIKDENDAVLQSFQYNENHTTTVYAKIFKEDFMVTLNNYWSEGQILDLLSGLLFLRFIDLPIDPYYLSQINIPQDRFQTIKRGNLLIVNDSYNASYESFKSAFNSISKLNLSPKIIIMGEIKELGKYTEEYHIKVIKEALNVFDQIYFYDPQENFTYLSNDKVTFFKELKKIDEIISNTTKGVIYIKGSNATGINKYLKESDLIWKD